MRNRTLNIPANTYVYLNAIAVQTDPRWWGADSLQWRPSRWIITENGLPGVIGAKEHKNSDGVFNRETLFHPADGTYLPWSEGGRGCPGKRYSEGVFVAVLARLMQGHRITGIPASGEEDSVSMKARLLSAMEDSTTGISIQMRSDVPVSWSAV